MNELLLLRCRIHSYKRLGKDSKNLERFFTQAFYNYLYGPASPLRNGSKKSWVWFNQEKQLRTPIMTQYPKMSGCIYVHLSD